MKKAADIAYKNSKFILSGDLDFSNMMQVFKESTLHFTFSEELSFDMSRLNSSNSSVLALMIEWIKLAKRYNKPIRFENISKELMAIAKAAGVDKLIEPVH